MTTAPCPHCGRPDAPVEDGFIDRHRRLDWRPDVSPSNELCAAGGMGAFHRPGQRCDHITVDPNCRDTLR